MKTILTAAALTVLAIGLTACGNKKKSDVIITQRVEKAKPSGPIKMQEYNDTNTVEWIGRKYHVMVSRQPSDSLPTVKDENGQQFIDNVFTLTVSRADGSVFYNRKFTKANFLQYINEDYRDTGILEGIVFDKPDGDWLVFGASVGHPQTDEYIPLVIRLSRMGVLEIRQDTEMDTAPQQGLPQDEDEDGV